MPSDIFPTKALIKNESNDKAYIFLVFPSRRNRIIRCVVVDWNFSDPVFVKKEIQFIEKQDHMRPSQVFVVDGIILSVEN